MQKNLGLPSRRGGGEQKRQGCIKREVLLKEEGKFGFPFQCVVLIYPQKATKANNSLINVQVIIVICKSQYWVNILSKKNKQ